MVSSIEIKSNLSIFNLAMPATIQRYQTKQYNIDYVQHNNNNNNNDLLIWINLASNKTVQHRLRTTQQQQQQQQQRLQTFT